MTLNEYNEIRRRLGIVSLISGLSFIAVGLLSAAKLLTLVVISLLILSVSAILAVRYLNKLKHFRCPQCGKDPTVWVSSDPSDDAAHYDQFSNRCLHCKVWLGETG